MEGCRSRGRLPEASGYDLWKAKPLLLSLPSNILPLCFLPFHNGSFTHSLTRVLASNLPAASHSSRNRIISQRLTVGWNALPNIPAHLSLFSPSVLPDSL